MRKSALFVLCLMAGGPILSLHAAPLSSDAFPYRYEADALPSAVSPAYSYTSSTGMSESEYAAVSGGVLVLDSDTDGPDNDSGWYSLSGGDGTVWNPAPAGPLTIEVRMKSYPNNAAQYHAFFEWFDVNTSILLQIWHNRLTLNGVEVTGLDNQSGFHVFRIVSDEYAASADQKFDLYRDGVMIIEDAPNNANYSGSKFQFGDMTGLAESHVEIDYIRWDDTAAWEPLPAGESIGYPYRYEADALPSASTPLYAYSSGTGMLESDFASVSNGILKLDTNTDAVANEGGWYTLAGGAGTVWNPPFAGPYTMEVRMRSLPNNSATYNAWFYWFDANSTILLQVWNNKVSLNSVEVTGLDNQSAFHVFRIVSQTYPSSADQRFDLYRDNVLIIDDAPNFANYTGSKFQLGDMTGAGEVNVEIDYIRWDDQNAWIPSQCGVKGYLKGDVNRDCLVDMGDIAVFALGWMYSTDPEDMFYIDCSDPQNADLCR